VATKAHRVRCVKEGSLGEPPNGSAMSAERADDFDSDGHEGLLSALGVGLDIRDLDAFLARQSRVVKWVTTRVATVVTDRG
jgi:hypothetical protein